MYSTYMAVYKIIQIVAEDALNKFIILLCCFQLSGNIIKLYARFVEEGKATISLTNPAQDICISKVETVAPAVLFY